MYKEILSVAFVVGVVNLCKTSETLLIASKSTEKNLVDNHRKSLEQLFCYPQEKIRSKIRSSYPQSANRFSTNYCGLSFFFKISMVLARFSLVFKSAAIFSRP